LTEAFLGFCLSHALIVPGIDASVVLCASANVVENFVEIGAATGEVFAGIAIAERFGKLTFTVSPQPRSKFARGWPKSPD
jgi:hypothetical protein